MPLRQAPRELPTAKSPEQVERTLLREFMRYKSVAGLAQSVAVRVADGRTAEDLIVAADASDLRGVKARDRAQRAP
jgi:hypothetical protein